MKIHHKIAKVLGYELIRKIKHPSVRSHLINVITHYGIDLVLDVGANKGQFGKMLRKENYTGVIHSFEPVTSTFNELESVAKGDDSWHTHNIALGAQAGTATINIAQSSDLSSLLAANEFGKERFNKIETTRQQTVQIDTLDHFLATHVGDFSKKAILLKMDTQGYDLEVFKGATGSLPYAKCILSELSVVPIYAGAPHYLDALALYEKSGFAITGLYPISRNADLSVIEFDCMMVKRRETKRP